jgi:[ribosomal protein S5]-alanine N-acetyltransferase
VKISEKLQGANLVLATLDEKGVTDAYVDWLNDPEVGQFMETRHKKWTKDSVGQFVSQMLVSPDQLLFGIYEGGKHIGNIKLGPINTTHQRAEVSLFIGDKQCWGKGRATEAISLVRDYAFKNLGLKKLTAGMYAANIGSLKAFQAAGFALEGTLKGQFVAADGKRTDSYLVGLVSN